MATNADRRAKQLYEFGPFRVDAEKELLLRDNETIPLAPKAFQVLLVLIRNKKEIVTKDELLKAVWPDTFVEETNLSRNIFLLRKALGESPQDHQYIVTVPGRGYRFAEEVKFVPEELNLVAASHSTVQVQVTETRPWGWIVFVSVVLIAAAVGAYEMLQHRAPVLTGKDPLVLADFENTTGDPVFDGTLRQGLAFQLEQSPYLRVLDDAELQRDLRLMNVSAGARITGQIAHDVCVREGGAATIDGAIAGLGKSYVVTLEAIACHGGRTLAREQVQAEDKEHVLSALGSAATAIRGKLGESMSSIQQLNQPLEQATTPSLEALQNYTEGLAVMGQGRFLAAAPLYQRAIAIDPNFTMAYYLFAVVYEQTGDMERAAEYANRAFNMVDRVSEFERTELTAYHYRFTGEWDKEIDAYELAVRKNYPREWSFHNQLAVTYNDMGQFDKGLKEGLEAIRLQPNVEAPYRRVLDAYMCTDHLAQARQTEATVRAKGIDGVRIHQRFLERGYIESDQATIASEIQWFAGRPEEYISFGLQAAELNLHGQRRESHKLYQRAADAARHMGFNSVADEFEEADARADALSGNCERARRLGRPALALAMCGDTARAEKLAAEFSSRFPDGTIWNAVQLPEVRTMIALQRGEPGKVAELMAAASPYERAYPDAIYVRGLVYLKMGEGAKAVTEFRKIVDHMGANWAATWVHPNWGQYYALAYLGMARGFTQSGDSLHARETYRRFLTLWKDADSDIPALRLARAENAKLN